MGVQLNKMMKNKNEKMLMLKEYLKTYCKRMGILDIEIPELIFDAEEFKTRICEAIKRNGIDQNILEADFYRGLSGHCAGHHCRYIFINIEKPFQGEIQEPTLRQLRYLLVHELIHYRFPFLKHGQEFEQRRILIITYGKEYPKEHITCPNIPLI